MYGAGNEPTTVDQFYTDHPELKVSPLGFIGLKNIEISNKNIKRLRYKTWNNNLNLIDKNDFKASEIVSGITFTNNGDGSWTLNGTSTSQIYWDIINSYIQLNTSHKYLLLGCPENGSNDLFLYVNNGGTLFSFDTGRGIIGTPTKNSGTITIAISNNMSVNDAIFKPQLYDLTAIYGAGKEPTTVEQFYKDYPLVKTSPLGFSDLGIMPSNSGYILNKYDNLSEELLEENVEKDTVNYYIPDKTNILLNKVEGNTKKVVQLLDKTVFATSGTKVGLTFTCNRTTGAVTVNGTATASSFWNPSGSLPLVNNHKYLICGNYDGIGELGLLNQSISDKGSGAIGTAVTSEEAPRGSWGIAWDNGTTFNNVTFYPQVFDITAMYGFGNEPTTVEQFKKDYSQFFDEKLDGIWNVRTSGISTTGENIYGLEDFIKKNNASDMIVTYDGKKCFKISRSFNPTYYFPLGNYSLNFKLYSTYEPSFCSYGKYENGKYTAQQYVGSSTSGNWENSHYNLTDCNYIQWYNKVPSDKVLYVDIDSFSLSVGINDTNSYTYQENKIDLLSTQTLNGINGVNDYIEVIDKGNGLYDLKKTQNIDSVDLGTLDWATETVSSGVNFYSTYTSDKVALSSYPMCQKYTSSSDAKYRNSVFFGRYSGALNITADGYDTATAFKTAMNGVILYYQLKTPVTTTIATNLTYNQVSAVRTSGGLLLVNDNNNQKYAQPNVTITENYQYKS